MRLELDEASTTELVDALLHGRWTRPSCARRWAACPGCWSSPSWRSRWWPPCPPDTTSPRRDRMGRRCRSRHWPGGHSPVSTADRAGPLRRDRRCLRCGGLQPVGRAGGAAPAGDAEPGGGGAGDLGGARLHAAAGRSRRHLPRAGCLPRPVGAAAPDAAPDRADRGRRKVSGGGEAPCRPAERVRSEIPLIADLVVECTRLAARTVNAVLADLERFDIVDDYGRAPQCGMKGQPPSASGRKARSGLTSATSL